MRKRADGVFRFPSLSGGWKKTRREHGWVGTGGRGKIRDGGGEENKEIDAQKYPECVLMKSYESERQIRAVV